MILLAQTNQRNSVTAKLILSAAIPKEGANRLNAWKLLKILLSNEIQSGRDPIGSTSPIFGMGIRCAKRLSLPFSHTKIT